MAKGIRRQRGRKREALVHQHLENVSRELLQRHTDVVRNFIGRNAGIYALYRKNKLYYVGLATALRGRLTAHVKNKHGNSWDRFSIYLTIKDQHLREIEALLLRIANPPGARQRGKLAQSKDMRRRVTRAIREKQFSEVSSLFGRKRAPSRTLTKQMASTANCIVCSRRAAASEAPSKERSTELAYSAMEKFASKVTFTSRCLLLLLRRSSARQMVGGFGGLNVDVEIGCD